MDVFGAGTEEGSRPLLPPGECWICEQSPTQEAIKVVDTRRNARPGGPLVHESVRKYICEDCIVELGQAVGMVKADEHEAALHGCRELEQECEDLAARLTAAEAQQMKVVSLDAIGPVFANIHDAIGKISVAKPVKATVTVKGSAGDLAPSSSE